MLPCKWLVDRQGVVRRRDDGYRGNEESWFGAALRAIDELAEESRGDVLLVDDFPAEEDIVKLAT